jgi:hypothetical protein
MTYRSLINPITNPNPCLSHLNTIFYVFNKFQTKATSSKQQAISSQWYLIHCIFIPRKWKHFIGVNMSTWALYMACCRKYRITKWEVRGLTIKFANLSPCASPGNSGHKRQYGLMTLAYQHFAAVLLLICESLFLSGVYHCLTLFWWAVLRVLDLELEQWMNIKFLVKLGKSGSEIRELLVQVYGDSTMKKTAVFKWVPCFSEGR